MWGVGCGPGCDTRWLFDGAMLQPYIHALHTLLHARPFCVLRFAFPTLFRQKSDIRSIDNLCVAVLCLRLGRHPHSNAEGAFDV